MRLGGLHTSKAEACFIALLFGFSSWIMFRTFSYNYELSLIRIAVPMWSDFAANLPLIRSFSMGENWPPEYPIYPGLPIRYHYLFFLLVGKLEALGVPLHWAINVPSIAGFFLLLLMIYLLAKRWFGDARVGVLGIAFFLFNGSLGFVQYFEQFPLSWSTLRSIATGERFTAMGPWDGGKVLGVWHLLVFMNQRHFSVALGMLLGFIYACHRIGTASRRAQLGWAALFGALIGLLPVFHKAVLVVTAVVMSVYFWLAPDARRFLVATGAISVAVMGLLELLSFNVTGAPGGFGWYPGFMIHESLSAVNAVKFFWYQFGLHMILIPLGCWLAPRRVRAYLLPALIVLTLAFLFRFSSRETLVGHKFFNFFLIVGQIFSAYAVIRIHDWLASRVPRARSVARVVTASLIFFLTLSGVIDFFPIATADMTEVKDIDSNPEAKWFLENTPRNAVVLTSELFFPPPSIAGRKVFLGYGYFTDGAGYDTGLRRKIMDAIYQGGSREEMCRLLRENAIDYVEVEDFEPNPARSVVNFQYFQASFAPEFVSREGRYAVYSTSRMCVR